MTNNRKPHVIVLRLAAVLLILVMLSTGMVAGRYARYISTATGSGGVGVAKYDISVSAQSSNNLTLASNAPANYTFTVTSCSEVSVEYDLVIILPKALPDGITISLSNGTTNVDLTAEGNQYVAVKAGTFTPQGGTHTYTMTLTATKAIAADTLSKIAIRVDARQVD